MGDHTAFIKPEPMTEEHRRRLEDQLKKMKDAVQKSYTEAIQTGVHPFIEFNGLTGEYVKMCEDALKKGIDFTEANVHTGQHIDMAHHQVRYVFTKLECIYGPQLFAFAVEEAKRQLIEREVGDHG